MLTIIGVVIIVIAVVVMLRARVPGGVNSTQLGSVSQRWLAEYRASHPT